MDYGFVAEYYDYVVPYRDRQDVPFYVEIARDSEGPVLELGCGTGRVLIPTARAGIEIVGLDVSPSMLSVCQEKLSCEIRKVQSKVKVLRGDMRHFDLAREFRLVTIPFRGFQHLITLDDQLSCLSSIHRHLIQGGRLVLDVFNPSLPMLIDEKYLEETEVEPEVAMPDGRMVVQRFRAVSRDLANQVIDGELIYYVRHPHGHQERLVHRFQYRYFFRFEVEHLLVRSGFQVEEVYSDFDKSPYGSKDPGELIFIAKKA